MTTRAQLRLTYKVTLAFCFVCLSAQAQGTDPLLASISPVSAAAGDPGFVLTINGANFVSGARVLWSGITVSTTFVSNAQLTAVVPSNLLANSGSVYINVVNPDGRFSGSALFAITQPVLSITTSALPTGAAGTAYSAILVASGGAPPYAWSLVGTLPSGLTLNSTGTISGTPTTGGAFTFTVRVTDRSQATAQRILSLSIAAPQLSITNASPLPTGTAGMPYSHSFVVSGGSPPYQWSATGALPGGLTLNVNSGLLSGTPQQRGSFNFTVQVTDNLGLIANKAFALSVNAQALVITTDNPLFTGTVGSFYSQAFFASGGIPPYRWAVFSGELPSDLNFDGNAGAITGTPSTQGISTFSIRVIDSSGADATKSFSITVELPRLIILTASLPDGVVGTKYSQEFAATGGHPPYTWSLIAGTVPGLAINSITGVLSGTPSVQGKLGFTVQAKDSAGASATKLMALAISPQPLNITSSSQLPGGDIGVSYSYTVAASGGAPPYQWSANGLPDGLTLDISTGVISGTPSVAGSLLFTLKVTDSLKSNATEIFRIAISLPSLPEVLIEGLPDTVDPAVQPGIQVALSSAYPIAINGQLTLKFTPETGPGDSTIQFSTGGRTVDFTIPAETTDAIFPASQLAIQTGTVAGVITITARLQSAGLDVTPSSPPALSTRIPRLAPAITTAAVFRTANGLDVQIIGYSTTREVTQAVFGFRAKPGSALQQTEITIPVESLFSGWYQDSSSSRFGSQFLFTQSFTVQGNPDDIVPESVTLSNRSGSSTFTIN